MTKTFIKSLPVVAMVMGDRMGVEVRILGSQAMTDGKTIYLPALPEGDDSAWILARGYLDHEAGHVRHTDFSVREDTPIHKALTNILEDIRIEQAMGRAYPGCAVNLRKLANHLAEEGAFEPSLRAAESVFLGWVLSDCRSRVLKQDGLAPIARKTHRSLEKKLGCGLMVELANLLEKVGCLTSTQQAHDLAKRILEVLRQQQDQSKVMSEGASPEGANSKPSQESANVSSTAEEQNTEKPQAGAPKKSSSDLDKNGSDPTASGKLPPSAGKTLERILQKDPGSFGDVGEIAAQALGAVSENASRENPDRMTGLYPGEHPAKDLPLGPPPDLRQVRHETVVLRSRLGSLVQASRLKRSCSGRVGRRMDHRILHRLSTGDTRVFRRKEEKRDVNTAVVVLLDRSGSMSSRIALASQTVMALADALNTVPGVNVCTGAFPGPLASVVPLTPFGYSVGRTIANYGISASGGTPLSQALGWARTKLAVRDEKRKILVVVTDGQPSNPQQTKSMLQKLEAEGVELIGLGISDGHAVGRFFSNNKTIGRLDDLPPAIFTMLQDALTKS